RPAPPVFIRIARKRTSTLFPYTTLFRSHTMSRGNTRWTHARAPDLDPWREQDACGVGFVARASGERSHAVTRLALEALKRVAHRSEEHTSELQSQSNLVCRLLLEKKKQR